MWPSARTVHVTQVTIGIQGRAVGCTVRLEKKEDPFARGCGVPDSINFREVRTMPRACRHYVVLFCHPHIRSMIVHSRHLFEKFQPFQRYGTTHEAVQQHGKGGQGINLAWKGMRSNNHHPWV